VNHIVFLPIGSRQPVRDIEFDRLECELLGGVDTDRHRVIRVVDSVYFGHFRLRFAELQDSYQFTHTRQRLGVQVDIARTAHPASGAAVVFGVFHLVNVSDYFTRISHNRESVGRVPEITRRTVTTATVFHRD